MGALWDARRGGASILVSGPKPLFARSAWTSLHALVSSMSPAWGGATTPTSAPLHLGRHMWQAMTLPHDLVHPHDALLRRTVGSLGLLPDGAHCTLRDGNFAAMVTPKWWPPTNVDIDDFESNDEVLSALSASCCLIPSHAVDFQPYLDGGFSDPMPDCPLLPTVTIYVLAGDGVDVAPGEAGERRQGEAARPAPWRRAHPFLRYDLASTANARALLDAGYVSPARSQWRYRQGQEDGMRFLRSIGHDPPPLPAEAQ
jgi:hypothetical protein